MIALLFAHLSVAAPPPLAETYALELRQASVAKVPVIGKTRSTTVSRSLVRVTTESERRFLTQQTCSVVVEDKAPLAHTIIPDAFIAALPITHRPIALQTADGGWRFTVDLGPSYVGYDPSLSPTSLPDDKDHPAVTDWDHDGRPGATVQVRVTGVNTFGLDVVSRSHALIDGTLHANGRVDGALVTTLLEQHVLDADHWMMRSSPVIQADPAASGFTMVPLAVGATCADVADALTTD